MSRSITEIKDSITRDFMNHDCLEKIYDIKAGESFSKYFSPVSVESVIFHIFASAMWVLEKMFDQHKTDVEDRIEEILPHRPKWYRDKVLNYMKNRQLVDETDQYDTTGMTEQQIEGEKVVKHAVAIEDPETSRVIVKIAGEDDGGRCPVDEETEPLIVAYLNEIKDAGVKIDLVNQPADKFYCSVDIYYNPMLLPENVKADCEDTIKKYIENLPFNGEYTNTGLINVLQKVEGVKVVEFRSAHSAAHGINERKQIEKHYIPEAGYFKPEELGLNMYVYGEI